LIAIEFVYQIGSPFSKLFVRGSVCAKLDFVLF
jgi:hypothetical protein